MSDREFKRQYLQEPIVEPRHPLLARASPCPFCASSRLSFGRMHNFVHCDNCGADGPEIVIRGLLPRMIEEHQGALEALLKWNMRPREQS